MAKSGNPNPVTPFVKGHNHSAKPRKRRGLSEKALRSAIKRNGDNALYFYEELFELKELEDGTRDYAVTHRNGELIRLSDRISAVNAWTKLVFINQPDDNSAPSFTMTTETAKEIMQYYLDQGFDEQEAAVRALQFNSVFSIIQKNIQKEVEEE